MSESVSQSVSQSERGGVQRRREERREGGRERERGRETSAGNDPVYCGSQNLAGAHPAASAETMSPARSPVSHTESVAERERKRESESEGQRESRARTVSRPKACWRFANDYLLRRKKSLYRMTVR